MLHLIVLTTYLTNRVSHRTDYAAYLDLYAYTAVLIVLFSYRMDTALFRFGKKKEDLPKVYGTAILPIVLSGLVIVVLGFSFSQQIATWLTYPDNAYYIEWFSLIIAFDVVNLIPFAKLRLESRAKLFVLYKLINVVLTVILVLLFIETDLLTFIIRLFPNATSDIDYVFLSNLIASAFICSLLLIFHFPRKIRVDVKLWRKMALYGAPLVIVGIAANINQYFAVPLQKYFLGAETLANKDQAAVYGAVQKIAALLGLFTTAFNYAAEPFFFRNSDRSDARDLYGQIALYFVIAAGITSVTIYGLLDIFQLVIGAQFREKLYLIPILLMSYMFLGLFYNVSIWYKLADKTIYGAMISTVGTVITVVGSVMFLPIFGVAASAWVSLLCYLGMVILAWTIGMKKYPINYPVRRISAYLLATSIVLAICWLVQTYTNIPLLYGGLILLTYCGMIWWLEKDRLTVLLKKVA